VQRALNSKTGIPQTRTIQRSSKFTSRQFGHTEIQEHSRSAAKRYNYPGELTSFEREVASKLHNCLETNKGLGKRRKLAKRFFRIHTFNISFHTADIWSIV
jgi:hypothetical protein